MSISFLARPLWLATLSLGLCAGTLPPAVGPHRDTEPEKVFQRARTPDKARPDRPVVAPPREVRTVFNALKLQAFAPAQGAEALSAYTLGTLKTLSYPDLVDTLAGLTWSQIPDLWTYGPDAVDFFGDPARMQYLMDALRVRGSAFTTTDARGIPTLCEVLRCGFYQGYYHQDTLGYLNQAATQAKVFPALKAIQANPGFGLGTATQDEVVAAAGNLVANAGCDAGIVNGFTPIVRQVADNMEAYAGSYAKGTAVFNILNGVDYTLTWKVLGGGDAVSTTAFYRAIDAYLDQVFRLASYGTYNGSTAWLIDASIWFAGYDGRFHGTTGKGLQVITDVMNHFGRTPWTYPSAQAAEIIVEKYGARDFYGGSLDWTAIQQAIRAQYTPVKRDFDGGVFQTQVGGAVDPTKVKTLVWAHKEVKAHFLRSVRTDVPIDPAQHSDDALRMVIYDSPDAYRMNRFAYGLSTDNGGLYIENQGTFYTYERTPAQSIYSLEELFRHEGTHYLQGRFLEPGGFGASPLYDNDRLTWIDEGSAEFFAGASRTEGVKTRRSKAQVIANDGSAAWWTPYQVVRATYASGWTFYDYSWAFVEYLNRNGWDTYLAMADRLKANDAVGFSNLATAAGNNATFTTGYRSYLETLAANAGTYPDPATAPDYLAAHPTKPAAEVYGDIAATAGLTGVTTATSTCSDWATFTLRGAYAAGPSLGSALADWKAMDAKADGWLAALGAKSWSGYRTLTCYFVDFQKDASGQVTWKVVFHGILKDGPAAPAITAQPANVAVDAGQTATFRVTATGSNLAYQWFRNGAAIAGATSSTHAFLAQEADNGAQFTVQVSNSAGQVQSNAATLTVRSGADTQKPTLNLQVQTAPGTATFQPHAQDNVGVTRVTYWVDSLPAFTVTVAPFETVFNTASMAAGSTHLVYARAYDAAGNYGDSGWVSFQVVAAGPDTQAPAVSVAAVPGSGGAVTFNATATDNVGVAKVIFYLDRWTNLKTDTAAPWSATFTGVSKGTHYVCAEARDAANNVAYTSWVTFVQP